MIICVEGNIGAGKSSVLSELKSRGFKIKLEPVDAWSEWLKRFYADRNRWAFAFQMKVAAWFAGMDAKAEAGTFVERSCLSCRHVFGQLLYNQGCLSAKEWELFKQHCDLCPWEPDIIIHVATPAATCLERIQGRDREGEGGIDAEYISRIDFQYSNLLKYFKGRVVTVDGLSSPAQIGDDITAKLAELGVHVDALRSAA